MRTRHLLLLLQAMLCMPLQAHETIVSDTIPTLTRISEKPQHTLAADDIWKPFAESVAINAAVWAWDHYLFDRVWARVDGHSIRRNLKSEWVFDTDSYSGNQFSHPYHGSMFYNAARYHGHSFYTAALYPLVGSTVWEMFCETNRPAVNDFFSTGIGGSAIGEVTHRSSDLLFDDTRRGFSRVVREIVGTALNPSRGVHRMVSGEMFRVSPDAGKMVEAEPFTFDLQLGDRYMHEMRHGHKDKHIPFIEFDLNYGDRFAERTHHQPYDWFHVRALLNLGGSDGSEPTFSDLDLRGRIVGRQHSSDDDRWHTDLGLFQTFRYIDNYGHYDDVPNPQLAGDFALVNEAMSFGFGYAVKHTGRHATLTNDFLFNAVGLGGITADHYQPRRYSFASGFSLRDDVQLALGRTLLVGNDFYFARLFTPRGSDHPEIYRRSEWGDKVVNSVFLNRSYLRINFTSALHLNLCHTLHYRRSNYRYFPSHHAKSYELHASLGYRL